MPTDVPVNDPTVTTDKMIKVTFANPPPVNGGSPILSYELQMDDGLAGPFTSLVGFNTDSMATSYVATQGVVKGRYHLFKYRALNYIGWGPFSNAAAVLAATVPTAPLKPLFNGFTGSVMNLVIQPSPDHGGSTIINY